MVKWKTIRPTNVVIIGTLVSSNNFFTWRLVVRLRNRQKKIVRVPRQTQSLVPSEESATVFTEEVEHDISQSASKKTL